MWVSKILNSSGELILLKVKFSEDRTAFYYLLGSAPKIKELQTELRHDTEINIEEFGQIVATGWGEPSDEIKQMIKEKYGASE